MATTTIGSLTAVTAANLTGAAVAEVEDSNGDTRKTTLATLRTKMFAGGTGYTAADPMVCGTINASGAVTGTASSAAFLAGKPARGGTNTVSVTSSATLLMAWPTGYTTGVFDIEGNDGSNFFIDRVATGDGCSINVLSSSTILGTPVARTYTVPGGVGLKLAMASGTYNVITAFTLFPTS